MLTIWFAIHVIGALIAIALLALVHSQKESNFKSYLMLTSVCCGIIMVSRCFFITCKGPEALVLTVKFEYFGKCFASYYGLMFLLNYRQIKTRAAMMYPLFFVNLVACIIIFTNEYHHLYYGEMTFVQTPLGLSFVADRTPFYYFYMLFLLVEMVAYVIVSINGWLECEKGSTARKAAFYLMMAGISPDLMFVFALCFLIPTYNIDIIPLGILLCMIFMVISCQKYKLFELIRNAKDFIIDHLEEGIMVFDQDFKILYQNPYMEDMISKSDFHFTNAQQYKDLLKIPQYQFMLEDMIYESHVSKIDLKKGGLGYLIRFTDVTNIARQAEEMRELKEHAEAANEAKSGFISNISHEIRTPMNGIIGMTEILLRDEFTPQQTEYLQNIQTSGNALLSLINDLLDFSKMESGKFELVNDVYDVGEAFANLSIMFLTRIGEKPIEFFVEMDPHIPRKLYGDCNRIRQLIINFVNNAIKYTEEGYVKITSNVLDIVDDDITLQYVIEDTGQGIKEEDIPKLFEAFQRVDMQKNSTKEGTGLGLSICKELIRMMNGTIDVKSEYGKGSCFSFTYHQKLVDYDTTPNLELKPELKGKKLSCCFSNDFVTENFVHMMDSITDFEYVDIEDVFASKKMADIVFVDSQSFDETKAKLPKETLLYHLFNPTLEEARQDANGSIPKPIFSQELYRVLNTEHVATKKIHTFAANYTAPDANILIVDDSIMNLKVACGLLKPLEIQIDTASSGAKAIEMATEKQYDIIFMDHMMPEMDGIEASTHIRNETTEYNKTVPIVALTANAVQGAKEEFLSAGLNDFVAKPINIQEITTTIKHWLPEELIKNL